MIDRQTNVNEMPLMHDDLSQLATAVEQLSEHHQELFEGITQLAQAINELQNRLTSLRASSPDPTSSSTESSLLDSPVWLGLANQTQLLQELLQVARHCQQRLGEEGIRVSFDR